MWQKGIIFLQLFSGVLLFHQNDYKMEFQRMELGRYNKEHVSNMKVATYKYNRTTPLVNITFTYTKNLGPDLQVVVQAYNFLSNEYRWFPLRFQFGFCTAVKQNEFGLGRLLKCGNFSNCAVGEGTYYICNFTPDASRFPPYIPDGKYKLDLEIHYGDTEEMVLGMFVHIYRPII